MSYTLQLYQLFARNVQMLSRLRGSTDPATPINLSRCKARMNTLEGHLPSGAAYASRMILSPLSSAKKLIFSVDYAINGEKIVTLRIIVRASLENNLDIRVIGLPLAKQSHAFFVANDLRNALLNRLPAKWLLDQAIARVVKLAEVAS